VLAQSPAGEDGGVAQPGPVEDGADGEAQAQQVAGVQADARQAVSGGRQLLTDDCRPLRPGHRVR
jgi:hypothetical protein